MRFLLMILIFSFACKMSFAASSTSSKDPNLAGIVATNPDATEGDKTNQLATSICQLILLLNGRTGRAIAIIAIFALAFMFMTSRLSVPVFATFVIGLAMLFGAKSIALIMLPSYVKVKDIDRGTSVKKTPDELIREVCPELK